MERLLKAGIVLMLLLSGCGDAGAVGGGGEGGIGGSGGSGGMDGETGLAAECDFESCWTPDGGTERCMQWAEFPVNPGQTEHTVCTGANATYVELYPGHPLAQATCWRAIASYYEGTRTGFVHCSVDTISITVHP